MGLPLGPISSSDPAIHVMDHWNVQRALTSKFHLWLAKLFGKKQETIDTGVKVTTYYFKDKVYVADVQYIGHSA